MRHVVMQAPAVDELKDDPQTLGCLVQLVHAHDVAVPYALHDLYLSRHALRKIESD